MAQKKELERPPKLTISNYVAEIKGASLKACFTNSQGKQRCIFFNSNLVKILQAEYKDSTRI